MNGKADSSRPPAASATAEPASPAEPRAGSGDPWPLDELVILREAVRALSRELADAERDAQRAQATLERFRRRRAIRVANRLHDELRPMAVAARAVVGRQAPPRVTTAPTANAGTPGPAAFRARFLAALDRPEDAPDRLRVAIVRGSTTAAAAEHSWPESLLAAAGWLVVSDPGAADVLLVDPSTDVHSLPRGPVLLGAVGEATAAAEWPSIDDVDVVVVPDEATAGVLRSSSAVMPHVVSSGDRLRAVLRAWGLGDRVGIAIGIPNWEVAPRWGDLHFARDIQRQLELQGIASRIHLLPDWADPVAARDDVAIHIFGLTERAPLPGQRTILWAISHPERLNRELLRRADRVYVASDLVAERVADDVDRPVASLHQATDPERFPIDRSGPHHDVLFVGNTRGVRRWMVEALVPTSFDLALYGSGWENQPGPADLVRGRHIPNDEVHRWYSSASIVLNDHWPDMREQGFLSNRIYDALAAGAFVISDRVAGIDAEFDGGVVTAATGGELRWAIHDALAAPERRLELAARGRQAVLDRHTFAHRVGRILADLAADLGRPIRPSRLDTEGGNGG